MLRNPTSQHHRAKTQRIIVIATINLIVSVFLLFPFVLLSLLFSLLIFCLVLSFVSLFLLFFFLCVLLSLSWFLLLCWYPVIVLFFFISNEDYYASHSYSHSCS